MNNWSDDETLWEAMMPALSAPERFTAADADAEAIAAAVRLRPGAAILDLGCGAGVHAVAFAARGYAVTGVDLTASLLRLAETQAQRRAVKVSFVRDDMRHFVRPSAYDLATSLYSSFGYFDAESNSHVLENICQSLRRGGVLVLDVFGRETFDAWWQERASYEIRGTAYAVRRQVESDLSSLREHWTAVTQGVRKEFSVSQQIYSGPELKDLLHQAGFQRVELFGAFDAVTRYGDKRGRLVAFAYR